MNADHTKEAEPDRTAPDAVAPAPGRLFLGGAGPDHRQAQTLTLKYANRHGLIAGATGTGKTVTLQVMAEGFSRAGTPVFLADVKGDLAGLSRAGDPDAPLHSKLAARAQEIGLDGFGYAAFPVVFWDLFGEQGHPIRARICDIGPVTLSQLLDLSEAQEGVLNVVFRAARDAGLDLIDLKDLRAMLQEVANKSKELSVAYGNVSRASVAAIQRRLLVLETQGADRFFGEPALKLEDMLRRAPDGSGQVNLMAAERLMRAPRLYATFLFWLLTQLFEKLPEIGDPEKPVMAFFFDEAHLLFDRAPKALLERIELVARLIRSKGVGVYFVSQSPSDIPQEVLGQLGNRVQHALRAYTPRDHKALRAAAETFRSNPAFDTAAVIPQLGVGEALVSVLEADGVPSVAARTLIRPPSSRIGPVSPQERAETIAASPSAGVYDTAVDRHSAYEELQLQAARAAADAAEDLGRQEGRKRRAGDEQKRAAAENSRRGGRKPERIGRARRETAEPSSFDGPTDAFFKSMARKIRTRGLWGVIGKMFGR